MSKRYSTWIFKCPWGKKKEKVNSVYFAHQLSLTSWQTILSFIIKRSERGSRLDRPFVFYWPYPPLRLLRCKCQMLSSFLSNTGLFREGCRRPFLKERCTIACFGCTRISWASSKMSPCSNRLLMTVPSTAQVFSRLVAHYDKQWLFS